MSKYTKIVATISDARCDVDFIKQLYESGMNVVRMNSAHLQEEGFQKIIDNVRAVSNKIAILMDTKGPEVRTTALSGDSNILFSTGDIVRITGKDKHNAKPALEDVNFHVDDGEFVFLLGHSGAGKSTLLKLILREETPTEGRVLVNGQDVARLRRRKIPYLRRQMGIIFQDFRLIPTMTVYENIAFAMHVTNIGHKQIKERVNYMLELVHLEDKAKVYPDLLSGGEQQRVAVARALAHAPKLVIADEPTGNIDPELSLEMMELLERVSEMGITVLVVTHEHELVRHFDRRVVTLSGGHIISDVPTGSMIPHPPVDPKELEMEVSLV